MRIHPGGWSSGQLGARICWDGTWSGAVVGAVVGVGLHLWLVAIADVSEWSFIAVFLAIGLVIGAVLGLASGIVAAVSTLLVVGRRDRSEIEPTGVALQVLAVSMLVETAVGSAVFFPFGWAWPLLAAAPTIVLVRRQVGREQLQHLAEVAR